MSNLQSGTIVRIRAYGDTVLTRRYTGEKDGKALICSETEYEAALRENRKPVCIGFPVEDVIETVPDEEGDKER